MSVDNLITKLESLKGKLDNKELKVIEFSLSLVEDMMSERSGECGED